MALPLCCPHLQTAFALLHRHIEDLHLLDSHSATVLLRAPSAAHGTSGLQTRRAPQPRWVHSDERGTTRTRLWQARDSIEGTRAQRSQAPCAGSEPTSLSSPTPAPQGLSVVVDHGDGPGAMRVCSRTRGCAPRVPSCALTIARRAIRGETVVSTAPEPLDIAPASQAVPEVVLTHEAFGQGVTCTLCVACTPSVVLEHPTGASREGFRGRTRRTPLYTTE